MERDKDNIILTSDKQISTHTLTWSVTPITAELALVSVNFNSHAHVERDVKKETKHILSP